MNDLPNSSNMRLPELLDFASERGISAHVGYATLSQLRKLNGYGDLDVPDPIGKPREAYKECMKEIRGAIDKIEKLV